MGRTRRPYVQSLFLRPIGFLCTCLYRTEHGPSNSSSTSSKTPSAPPTLSDKLLYITLILSPPSSSTTIRILPTMSLKIFKLKIQKTTGIPSSDMRLTYIGVEDSGDPPEEEELVDEKKTMGDLGVSQHGRVRIDVV